MALLEDQDRKNLIDWLSRLPSLSDEDDRDRLLDGLPDDIFARTARNQNTIYADISAIVASVDRYSRSEVGSAPIIQVIRNGFREALASEYEQQLHTLLNKLEEQLGLPKTGRHSSIQRRIMQGGWLVPLLTLAVLLVAGGMVLAAGGIWPPGTSSPTPTSTPTPTSVSTPTALGPSQAAISTPEPTLTSTETPTPTAIPPSPTITPTSEPTPRPNGSLYQGSEVIGCAYAHVTRRLYFVDYVALGSDSHNKFSWLRLDKEPPDYIPRLIDHKSLEDVALSHNGQAAYITTRDDANGLGTLLAADLTVQIPKVLRVIAKDLHAPQQISIPRDDDDYAYVIEFDSPGRLLRINVSTGEVRSIGEGFNRAIGLLVTRDLRYAFISEQADGGNNSRVIRLDLNAFNRTIVEVTSNLTYPFFLTWANQEQTAILVSERGDTGTGVPGTLQLLENVVSEPAMFRQTTVASGIPDITEAVVIGKQQLALCGNQQVRQLNVSIPLYDPHP